MSHQRKNYTVLVVGASGFLGQHVVGLLQTRADHVTEIRVLDIEPYVNKTDFAETKKVRIFTGSILDRNLVEKACTDVNCVMHLASIVDISLFADYKKSYSVNVEGTRTIIEACKTTGVSRLIYCSTAGVTMARDSRYMNVTEEDTSYPQQHLFPVYGKTKQMAEELVIAANCEALLTVALRPVAIYGDYDWVRFAPAHVNALAKKIGYYVELDMAPTRIDAVYVGNVAWSFLMADDTLRGGKSRAASGECYYVTDDTPKMPRMGVVEAIVAECNIRRLPLIPPPWAVQWIIWFIFLVLRIISYVYPVNCPLGEWVFDIRSTTWLVSGEKARRLLGNTPLYSPEEAKKRLVKFINYLKQT